MFHSDKNELPNLSQLNIQSTVLPHTVDNTSLHMPNLDIQQGFLFSMMNDLNKKTYKEDKNSEPQKEPEKKEIENIKEEASFTISDNEDISKTDSQLERIKKLKNDLNNEPKTFNIYNNNYNNDAFTVIQNFINKKEVHNYYTNLFRNINLIKWLKVYKIITDKEVQNISFTLNFLRNNFTFNGKCPNVLCEVKEVYIIDCFQLLEVIDIDLNEKKIILTRRVNEKIKLIHENFVNEGDFVLFKKMKIIENKSGFDDFSEIDVKDIQIIVPFAGEKDD